MADKKLVIGLSVNSGTSVQELEKVRDAAMRMGAGSEQAADNMVRAFENAANAQTKVTQKIEQTGTVSMRDGAKVIQTFESLKNSIDRMYGSLDQAPAEIQETFRKLETGSEEAKAKVRELTDALDDQKGELKEGGERWTGMGDAINKALGPAGAMQAKILLIGAAFKEGWQAGQQLNSFFQTDMSVWEETSSRIGRRIGVVITALSDQAVAFFNLAKSLISMNVTEIKNAAQEMADSGKATQEAIANALTATGAEFDKLHPSADALKGKLQEQQKAAEDAAKAQADLAAETAKGTAENEKSGSATAKTTEEQKKAGEQTKLTAAEIKAQTEAAKEQAAAMEAAGRQVITYKDAQGQVHIETVNVASKTPEASRAIEALGVATGAANPAAQLLTASFAEMVKQLSADNIDPFVDAMGRAAEAMDLIVAKAPAVAAALKQVGDAAAAAAGEGDADFIGPVMPS
jgi:chromosome segregation ATPase